MQEMMELMGQVNTIANAYKRSQILFTALDGNVFALLEVGDRDMQCVSSEIGTVHFNWWKAIKRFCNVSSSYFKCIF